MPPAPEPFPWEETRARLEELSETHALAPDAPRRRFVSAEVVVYPPLLFPLEPEVATLAEYLDGLPARPGRHLVLLLQAGAASLGWFAAAEEVATKSIRRYVVRGRGKAQPTWLETRGKSRYGSRLRLRNALRLRDQVIERTREWVEIHGAPDRVYYSAPVRLWGELLRARPAPPFSREDRPTKIPWDLGVPTTELLLKTYRRMGWGRIVSP